MQFVVNLGRQKTHKAGDPAPETVDVAEKVETVFNRRNLAIFGTGVALGIILKQQSEIRTLKRTVGYLQDIIH
jgi:hypothetical protein